jgi:hypothetical protein
MFATVAVICATVVIVALIAGAVIVDRNKRP